MRRSLMLPLAALAGVAAGALELRGQAPRNTYNVGAHAGYLRFNSGTGLADAPMAGVDVTYTFGFNPLAFVSREADFGIGFNFAASRPLTRGDQFPIVAFDFGDTTQLLEVNQRVTLMHYGVQAIMGMPVGRFRVYGVGGVGGYTFQLDSRQNLRNRAFTHQMFQLGGGIAYAVTKDLGFRAEARDLIFLGYDRSRLDPTIPYVRDQRIRDAVSPPDATWHRPQNLQVTLVFNYVPARAAKPEGEQ